MSETLVDAGRSRTLSTQGPASAYLVGVESSVGLCCCAGLQRTCGGLGVGGAALLEQGDALLCLHAHALQLRLLPLQRAHRCLARHTRRLQPLLGRCCRLRSSFSQPPTPTGLPGQGVTGELW
eukprot:70153-Rhodomonas_salina.3